MRKREIDTPRNINVFLIKDGLVANAPGLVAVHEAMHFAGHPDVKTIHVVSVGTYSRGTAMDPNLSEDIGILTARTSRWFRWARGWGFRLFELTINSQEAMSNDMLKHWLGDRHHLIDGKPKPEQTNYLGLDDTSEQSRKALLGQADVISQDLFSPALLTNIRSHEPSVPNFYHGPNKNTEA